MKVGFDISQIAHPGGVARYTKNLALNLTKVHGLEMVFFYSSLRKPYRGGLKNVKKFNLPPTLFEVLFNKLRNISIEKFLGPIDIFHSSDWIQPPTKAKKITTYHDVVPLIFPELSHPKIIEVHKRRLEIVEKEVDKVIAVSKSTKEDLMRVSKIPSQKITVIYEGVEDHFKKQEDEIIVSFKKKYNLPEKFVLAIGGIGKRKNLQRIKQSAKEYNLVITGDTIPLLPDEEMPFLYSSAEVLLYPSLYEGFGLPILEAMACGTPVVTSNTSSLSEVGGDAAIYADPTNISAISSSLKKVIEDKDLRETMIKKGLLQAKKFSWEKAAKETAEVYQEVFSK